MKSFHLLTRSLFKTSLLGLCLCSLSIAHAVTLDGIQVVANQLVASLPDAGKHPEFKNDVISEVECLCRVPERHLESIYRYGLQNLHQIGHGCGINNRQVRLDTELTISGCKPDSSFSSELSELLPIYGLLNLKTPTRMLTQLQYYTAEQYGSILIIFHPNAFDSVTYTLDDSLRWPTTTTPLSALTPLEDLIHFKKSYSYIEFQKWGPKGRRINRENVREISIPSTLSKMKLKTREILERIHQETGIPITVYTSYPQEKEMLQVMRTPHPPLSSLQENQNPPESNIPENTIPALLESSLAFQRNLWPDLANTKPKLKNRAEARHAAKRESLFHFGLTNTHYPKVTAAVIYALFSDSDDLNWCEDSHLDKLLTCLQDEKVRTPVFGALKKYYSHSNELLKQIQVSQKSATASSSTSSSTFFTPSLSSLISLLREMDPPELPAELKGEQPTEEKPEIEMTEMEDNQEEFKLGEIIPPTYSTENSTLSENSNAPPPKRKSDAISYSIPIHSSAKRIKDDF